MGKVFQHCQRPGLFLENKMRTTTQTKKKNPTKKTSKSTDPHGWAALFKSIKEPLTAEKILLEERHNHSWKSFVTNEENRILWGTWRRVTDLNPAITTFEMTRIMLMKAAAEIAAELPPSKPPHA